ncbi:MAG: manganese efflux pump [Oscillospiraceae bacterium]|nr:manganese efflux pump [Oscillospiraceae bacterium]
MELDIQFFVSNLLLGIGLAMDAFSVSLANGLNEPCIKTPKMLGIAGIFGIFQGLMPLIGWFCVHNLVRYFKIFEPMIPWIALLLLGWIGINMIRESIKGDDCPCGHAVGFNALLVQGVATSIDALSVGFTIAHYDLPHALLAVALIAAVTFVICFAGIGIGKKAGTKLAGKAGILGGSILILIGLEIFITSFL